MGGVGRLVRDRELLAVGEVVIRGWGRDLVLNRKSSGSITHTAGVTSEAVAAGRGVAVRGSRGVLAALVSGGGTRS